MSIVFGNRRFAANEALHQALRTSHGIELSGMLNELRGYHTPEFPGAVGTQGARVTTVLLYANKQPVGLDREGTSGSANRFIVK